MKLSFNIKLLSITLILLIVSFSIFLKYFPSLPLLTHLSYSRAVFDENHHLLRITLSEDEKYRLYTPLSQISSTLISATVLQEDRFFWRHKGVNPLAIIKAVWQTYFIKSRRVGASTITMQVARLRFGLNTKTFIGKVIQIIRALQIEHHYTKRQILEAYLNLASYGYNIEGIGAASLIYFNKSPRSLSLSEALTLSVIPQNPRKRTPTSNALSLSREQLFKKWVRYHREDKKQTGLIHLPLAMRKLHAQPYLAPHIVNYVLQPSSGYMVSDTIHTTLNLTLQQTIERIAHQYVGRYNSIGVKNCAVMVVDTHDMSVKALMGSVNFFDSALQGQINGAEIKRSPGSTLKPFIYGLALDQGLIHPHTILKDVPHFFGNYNPENFDADFVGPISAKDALILSRNIPAITLASQLKPSLYQFLEKAKVAQLKSEGAYGLALSLGGAELTMHELVSLYAMLVNQGKWRPLRFVKNEVQEKPVRLLSPEASFLILDILNETPQPLTIAVKMKDIAWKTGTSSGYRDAWAVGNVGPYILSVWVGNFDNSSNPAFIGKKIAAPLFFELANAIQKSTVHSLFAKSTNKALNLTQIPVCKASGLLPTRYCKETALTWFIPGISPIKSDTIYREVAINNKTGLRTCHLEKDIRFEIYEFWSTDLLKIFKQAGIQRRVPPPFEGDCSAISHVGLRPQINTPQNDLHYIINANLKQPSTIPFTAVTDADVRYIYWFINASFLGKSHPDKPLFWQAKAGKYVVRVVDDHGRSDARDLLVQVNG